MTLTRRELALGATGAAWAASSLAGPAIAQSGEPIRIGWLAALTGPSSAPAIGFDRGVNHAAETINTAGGVRGRKIELTVRDTQGDPTKAVNAAQELISRARVHAIYGPTNSGEALATNPIMARAKMPNLSPGFLDSLMDPEKFPNTFRTAPANAQIDETVCNYGVDVLKVKTVGIVGDSTGYGTKAVADSTEAFKKRGVAVAYAGVIDQTQPDVTPDMLRLRNGGAEAIAVWSISAGLIARLLNARAAMNWDVPVIGHPAMGNGEVGRLVSKPENWAKVYILGYRSTSFSADGMLPARTEAFVESVKGKINLADTTLWWVISGVDAVNLIAKAVEETGSTDNDKIIGFWNTVTRFPGLFAQYTWTPTNHNGLPLDNLVMSEANSQRDGAYRLAPGVA